MSEYKEPYITLFQAITKAIDQLEHHEYSLAVLTLEYAQRTAENQFITQEESGPE